MDKLTRVHWFGWFVCVASLWLVGQGCGEQKRCVSYADCPGTQQCVSGVCRGEVGERTGGGDSAREATSGQDAAAEGGGQDAPGGQDAAADGTGTEAPGESGATETPSDTGGNEPTGNDGGGADDVTSDQGGTDEASEPAGSEGGADVQPEGPADAGCQAGQTRECKSACGKGNERCENGQWVQCDAQEPKQEECNGVDDDCDGSVDEDFAELGKACQAGVGACQNSGKFVCKADKSGVECSVKAGTPTTEICDKKDNDCDGDVDEGCQCQPRDTQACGASDVGECKKGTQTCSSTGKWGACVGEVKASVERCDGKDNDCDGSTDEICGSTKIPYAHLDGTGKYVKGRGLRSAGRLGTGYFGVTAGVNCGTVPMFVFPVSSSMRPVAVTCNRSYPTRFDVRIGAPNTRTSKLTDWPFYAVQPVPDPGSAWGGVNGTYCPLGTCSVTGAYAISRARRISAGVYDVTSTACAQVYQPVFAGIAATTVTGYAQAYVQRTGQCRVQTFDLYGKAADRIFTFWVPNPNNSPWVTYDKTNKIVSQNNFRDTLAKWTINTIPARPSYLDVRFPAWNSAKSIAINGYQGLLSYYPTAVGATDGAYVYLYNVATATITPNSYVVTLFIQ